MNALTEYQLYMEHPWKEYSRGIDIIRNLQTVINDNRSDKQLVYEIEKKKATIDSIISRIIQATPGMNVQIPGFNCPIYPRVAWLPQPSMDDETGIATVPAIPESVRQHYATLPKPDCYYYLKQLADEPFVEHPTATVPSVSPEVDQATVPSASPEVEQATVPSVSPEVDQATVPSASPEADQPTPAQQAIAAIRSRRKKKSKS